MPYRIRPLILLAALSGLGVASSAIGATFSVGTISATDNAGSFNEIASSVPYATVATAPAAPGSNSTTSPVFTGLVFKTSFSQSTVANVDPSGQSAVAFTANAGDTYSLFGSSTETTADSTFSVSLFDQTTGVNIYSETPAYNAEGVADADGSGGPMLGTLAAGTYVFTLSDTDAPIPIIFQSNALTPNIQVDTSSVTASGGITLVSNLVPEPSMAGILFITAGTMLLLGRSRRISPMA